MRALRSNRATDREIDAFVRQFGRKNQRSAARCGHILARRSRAASRSPGKTA